ncbi:MAG: hypothetical protein JO110_03990 [Acetobacteraceae bacterium]|nr:hypothetical protein [Acetobacteraceae bacterium]
MGWRSGLARKDSGKPHLDLRNVIIALRTAPEWQEMFAWNEFTKRLMAMKPIPAVVAPCDRPIPYDLADTDITAVIEWMQANELQVSNPKTISRAIRAVAQVPIRSLRPGLRLTRSSLPIAKQLRVTNPYYGWLWFE